jgi:hypothetical protein
MKMASLFLVSKKRVTLQINGFLTVNEHEMQYAYKQAKSKATLFA